MSKAERQIHILVIDDEQEIRDLLTDFLEEKGFTVAAKADGIEGMEHLRENLPDMIVMDLLLPGEHGIDLVKKIKDKYFIPIIVISGIYRRQEIQAIIEEYFVEDFMEKPIILEELLEKINKISDERTV